MVSYSTSILPPRPPFSDLPLRKDGPRGNTWGLYGPDDELGLLNYITPDVIVNASKEIKHGISIPLDIPLNHFSSPAMGRKPFEHNIMRHGDHMVNDDFIHINTQSATQWDGFRHWGYQEHGLYYNGITQNEIENTSRIGIDSWVSKGGITTRGVLIDFARWAMAKSLTKPCLQTTSITAADLKQILAFQKTTLLPGDVLLIRSGYMIEHGCLSVEDQVARSKEIFPASIGLESSEKMLKFLWESGIVAVAGDMPTLEAWPWQSNEFCLHEWLLAGWGCPIGEYLDLDRLGRECEKYGRWTFMFSSMPLNVPSGVASPVNGIAIL